MLKKTIFSAFFILTAFALTACGGSFDLEDRAIATAAAIDYDREAGFRIILSMPSLDKEEALNRITKAETAPTIKEAISKIDQKSSKQLYFGHTKAIILGADLLRTKSALAEVTAFLTDNVQIDKNIIIVGAYNIEEIMNLDPKEDKLTGFYISSFYDSGKERKTFVNKETLLTFMKDSSQNSAAAIPLLTAVNDEPAFTGVAVLKAGELIGILEGKAAYGFMWLTDKAFNGTLTSSSYPVSAEISEKETSYAFYEENGSLKMTATINVQGNMWNFTDDEIKSKASEYLTVFKDEIKAQSQAALAALNDLSCDPLDFSAVLQKENPDLYKKYPQTAPTQVNINVNLSLNFV